MTMATAKRKTMPKPVAKRPAKRVTTAERMRLATKPSRSRKPTEQRMREATHAIRPATPQKASSPPMTTTTAAEPRGAGTGENAVLQRSRPAGETKTPPRKHSKADDDDVKDRIKKEMAEAVKNNQQMAEETDEDDDDAPEPPEQVTEYPEGDPDKGALDPEHPERPIAHRDRRAYLIRQAERNQAANDQLNAMQVQQNKRVGEVSFYLQDPQYMLETSMQTAMTALKAHDPDVVREKHEEMAKRMKARQDREDKKNGTK